MKPVLDRLWAKTVVDDTTGCWLWQGAKNQNGHGNVHITINGVHKTRRPHQISYEHFKGPVPRGKVVRHGCDMPACWNPEHLELGDAYQNMQDMMARGRGRNQFTSLADLGIEAPPPVETDEICPF